MTESRAHSRRDQAWSLSRAVRAARLGIAVAAAVSATGVFLLGMGKRDAGGIVVLLGWSGFIAALHAFGRLGTDEK